MIVYKLQYFKTEMYGKQEPEDIVKKSGLKFLEAYIDKGKYVTIFARREK